LSSFKLFRIELPSRNIFIKPNHIAKTFKYIVRTFKLPPLILF